MDSLLSSACSGLYGGPQKICPSRTCECDLIWEKDLTDAAKLRISRLDHPRLSRWALSPMTSVLIRGEDIDRIGENIEKVM